MWDSGQVPSSDSTYVAYTGPALAPSTAYTWTVATATASCQSGPSAPATFVTSLFNGWSAGAMFLTYPSVTFAYFRKEVTIPSGVVSAIAHVTAEVDEPLLSGYKLYINDALADIGPGRGEAPVWEGDGGFRGMPYATLDLTQALSTPGTACLALQCMHAAPLCIFQVTLYLSSGANVTMVTDGSWQAFNGDKHRMPGRAQHGGSAGTGFLEYIDARGEPVGWRAPGFSPDGQWTPAVASQPTAGQVANFVSHMKPPFQVHDLVLQTIYPGPPPPDPPPTGPVTCGRVSENENLQLACPDGTSLIQAIDFASFGTPTGTCSTQFSHDPSCDAPKSLSVVQNLCLGKARCTVAASNDDFGGDPCLNTIKFLAVNVTCPGKPGPPPPPPVQQQSFIGYFEKEFQGGLRLDVTNGTAGSTVFIQCGESLSSSNAVGYTWGWEFTWTLRDGPQVLEQHKFMECRFVSLTFSGPPVGFTLSAWQVNYPWAEEDSAFSSSNATLDAVYDLCRYTVHRCDFFCALSLPPTPPSPHQVPPCSRPPFPTKSARRWTLTPIQTRGSARPMRRTASLQLLDACWCSGTSSGAATPTPTSCCTPRGPWSGSKSRPSWAGRTTWPRGRPTWRWPLRTECMT